MIISIKTDDNKYMTIIGSLRYYVYILLKALPPVCMVYTARGESQVANIALGFALCYICHETLLYHCTIY